MSDKSPGNQATNNSDSEASTLSNQRSRQYSAPALEKGIEILEFLSTQRNAYSLGEIAKALSRSKGEIFRMVAVLEQQNYLERDPGTENYRATNKMFQLGLRRPINRSIVQAALPCMNFLSEKVGYPCQLTVMSGSQIVVIAREDASDLLSFAVRIGYRKDALKTGSGLCLIAFMQNQQRERFFSRLADTEAGLDVQELGIKIKKYQKQGYVACASTSTIGVTDLSCPIIDTASGGAIAALTIPYLELVEDPISIRDVISEMMRAAKEISSQFHP